MKVEIKTNKQGNCEYFMIDGKKYGTSVYSLDIHIEPCKPTEIIIKAKSNEFILDSENTKLYLESKEKENKE